MSKYELIREIYNTNPFDYNDCLKCEESRCFNCPHCRFHHHINVLEHTQIDEVPIRFANFEVDIFRNEKNRNLIVKLFIDP